MSTIEDHLRKLGAGWDKEDLEHTEDAIERYLMFLNDFRTLSTPRPSTESDAPVIPMSVIYAVPLGRIFSSAVTTCV